MQTKLLPGSYLYENTCNPMLLQKLQQQVTTLEFRPNPFGNNHLSVDPFINDELIDWLDSQLLVIQKLQYPQIDHDRVRFRTTSCWVNRASKGQTHHRHTHSNAVWSGILYLTTCTEGGSTNFYIPNPWYKLEREGLLFYDIKTTVTDLISKVTPVAGKLLVFPSQLQHDVDPHTSSDYRYSISFNVYPTGILGPTVTSRLNIETKI